MRINVQCVNFTSKESLMDYMEKKVNKLEVFFDRIVDVDVYLKLDNTHDKENKIAEIKMHVPGEEMLVKKNAKTFEEAIELCTQALERMLKRWKEKK